MGGAGCARLICLAALALASRAGQAESGWAGSLVATSDYVLRGLSQTSNQAALQADVHYQGQGGWYLGLWGSNVRFDVPGSPDREFNVYAGLSLGLSPDWSVRATAVHYDYPADRSDYNYNEVSFGADFQNRLFATFSWSPDTTKYSYYSYYGAARHRAALSYELSARQPLKFGFSAAVGVGYYDLTDLFSARYWAGNAGLLYAAGHWQVDVTYYEVDSTAKQLFGSDSVPNRWVATVLWRF